MNKPVMLLCGAIAVAAIWATAGFAQTGTDQTGSVAAPKTRIARVAKSLDPKTGAFHRVHRTKLKMSCSSCHSAETKDVLFLRRADVVPAAMPGQVDRQSCLGCHTAPAKPAWYGLGH